MKFGWISALAVLCVGPAFAGPVSPPPPPTSYDWTGPLVGANFGWSWNRNAYNGYKAAY